MAGTMSCPGDGAVTGCNVINVFAARERSTFAHTAFHHRSRLAVPVVVGLRARERHRRWALDVAAADNGPDSALWILPRIAAGFGKPIVVDEDNYPEPVEVSRIWTATATPMS